MLVGTFRTLFWAAVVVDTVVVVVVVAIGREVLVGAEFSFCVGDGAGVHETEALRNEGKIELAKRSVFQVMEGEIISQPPTEFGKDFYYGDILVAKYKGYEKNVEVAEYKISVNSSGSKVTIPFSTVEG